MHLGYFPNIITREQNMKMRQLWVGLVVMVMLCLTIGVTHAQEKSYSADHFNVEIRVEEGGAVLVTETAVFNFVGGPFTYVFRELPTDHTDGLSVVETRVDGVVYPVGENAGQVEIKTGDPMRITWHLEPTSNAIHTVVLTYRADGVVRQENGTDALYWQALPDNYDYFIGASEVVVHYPAQVQLVSEPSVVAGTAVTSRSPHQVTFTTKNLQPNSPLVFQMGFEANSLISAPPNWQTTQQTFTAQIPYWIALAVVLFATGLTMMVVYRRRTTLPSTTTKLTTPEPPGKLSPGIVGLLVGDGATPQWSHALGTLFSLAEKGVLVIEELPDQKWYRKHDFVLKQVEPVANLTPHEEGFLEMLFTDKNGRVSSLKLSDMGTKISGSAWKKYQEPLQHEIKQAGFLNADRQTIRTTLMVWGGVLIVMGAILFIGAAVLSDSFGLGTLAVGVAVMLLGIFGVVLGGSLLPLSDVGAETAVAWKQFQNYLNEVSKGKQPIDRPAMFAKYLPYAATFGLLHQWAKQFEKEGWTEMPAYFRVLPTTTNDQAMGVFVALSATANSSGGSAAGAGAGAAGAGAAGGGASGAG